MNFTRKQHLIIFLFFSFWLLFLSCIKKGNIEENLKPLEKNNYSPLDFIIKNKKVVGIGEYTHGDGKLFEIKTEIIKHLHQKLKFEAVLMESDFLSVEQVLPAMRSDNAKGAANIGIQSTWADSQEYLSLINYLDKSAKQGDTLYFHGFDSQMTGTESFNIHIAKAQSIENLISDSDYNNLISSLKIINTKDLSKVTLDSLVLMRKSVLSIKNSNSQLASKTYQWLKNVEANINSLIYLKKAPPITADNYPEILSHPYYLKSGSIRDSIMADNIHFYLKTYKKVILWAANRHLQLKSDDRTWMGELLKKSLGDDYYAILVLYNNGHWSYPQGQPSGTIPQPAEETLAYYLGEVNDSDISFLDIKSTEIPKMKIRENNFLTTDSIFISDYGDAILYVRNATGSTMSNDN